MFNHEFTAGQGQELDQYRIDFAQLPFEIYELTR